MKIDSFLVMMSSPFGGVGAGGVGGGPLLPRWCILKPPSISDDLSYRYHGGIIHYSMAISERAIINV